MLWLMVLLYMADVLPMIGAFLTFGPIACLVVLLIVWCFEVDTVRESTVALPLLKSYWKTLVAVLVFSLFLPSKSFVYTIVGLKVGEEVIQTELGQKVYDLLNAEIDELLKENAE